MHKLQTQVLCYCGMIYFTFAGNRARSTVVVLALLTLLYLIYQVEHTSISHTAIVMDSVLTLISADAPHEEEVEKDSQPQTNWEQGQSTNGILYHPPWYYSIKNMDNPFTSTKSCTRDFNYSSMAEALAANASPDKVIILPSTVDGGYQDMALNFYEFNLHRLNITNFVFMCIDKVACDVLKNFCIPAYLFAEIAYGDKAFGYKDQEFVDKATTKLRIVLSALKLGYHVLLTDLDIVFLKNPFNHFPCDKCDVQIQTNNIPRKHIILNSGFMYIKNSPRITKAFRDMVQIHEKDPTLHDQTIVNRILRKGKKANKLSVVSLPYKKWPAGRAYFDSSVLEQKHFYDQSRPADDVIIIHNNWIVGAVSKISRFKEHLMWVSDYNRYYSDPQRNYIMYDNPAKTDTAMEKSALSSAFGIASVLNRTVILPRFSEGTKPFSKFMDIDQFDKTYHGLYRENSFLANPRTPDVVISSITSKLLIDSKAALNLNLKRDVREVVHFQPGNPTKGATCEELKEWFQPFSDIRILRFHSLYGAFQAFDLENGRANCA